MLFDLRGRGRRRTVQVIYLGLALLLGGGLVLFGIGGDVQGGLFDAFRENGGSAAGQIEERRDDAAKRANTNPNDPAAWATLAEAEFQLAGQSEGYNQNAANPEQQFTGAARAHLVAAKRAWDRHLRLAGENVNTDTAAIMRNALVSLGDGAAAVRAQEVIIDGLDEPAFGDYAQLAALAYGAGQTRKGDLAADRAVELAPKDRREEIKTALEQQKTQAATSAAQGAAGATPGATPSAPSTTPGS
jgi:hypothetical protein